MNYSDAIIILVVGYFMYSLYKERADHAKTKNVLAVFKRMGELDELGKKLEDEQKTYNESLTNHTTHLVPDYMLERLGDAYDMPSGEMQGSAQTSEPPKFFKGVATEDIRTGQVVEIEIRTEDGATFVRTGGVHTPILPYPGES